MTILSKEFTCGSLRKKLFLIFSVLPFARSEYKKALQRLGNPGRLFSSTQKVELCFD
jgi:hypothetical protein